MICGVQGVECGIVREVQTKREKDIFVSMNRDNVSKTKA